MKTLRLLLLLFSAVPLSAFDWPGGTMNIPASFAGEEVFAGWVPSSPWGSTPFLRDPVVELRDAGNNVIAEQAIGGGARDWYDGGSRSGTAVFSVPAGSYSVTTRPGQRLIRIGGEGYSGFRLTEQSVTLPGPSNRPPTIAWTVAPGSVGSGQVYTIAAQGHDDDGNLLQVNVWRDGTPFAFAGGGSGFDGDSGNTTSDTGPASVTFTAQAVDASGAVSAVITQTVTVAAPLPVQYSLVTSAGPGGSVSAGGVFDGGTIAWVSAIPDATHDFGGWSGDAGGSASPVGITMDRAKAVQANFVLKSFPLTTSASMGGSVTPGGMYPYGTVLTLAATPDVTHRFVQWAGDAGGTNPTVNVFMDRPRAVQAVFTDKTAQTITFAPLADQPVGGAPLVLLATASSGLPVTFMLVSGPATLSGSELTITGPGAVTVQASQPGDAEYLPAPGVSRTFNAVMAAFVKYRPAGRTILRQRDTEGAAPFVLENP